MKTNNNIRQFRQFKGYSQKYVASRLGKSQPALSKIENGSSQVSGDVIERLSKILKVSKEKLFSKEELIMDYNKAIPDGGTFNGKNFFNSEKELLPPLNNMATTLFNQLSENKKLLHEVELNQEQLQQQLNLIIEVLIDKKIDYLIPDKLLYKICANCSEGISVWK